jgi:uncharacterized protein YcfJ
VVRAVPLKRTTREPYLEERTMQETETAKDPLPRPVRAAVFKSLAKADHAVAMLVEAGFSKDQITVVCPTCTTEKYDDYQKREPAGAHVKQGAMGGGAIGLMLGGLVALAGTGLLVAGPLLAGIGAIAGGFVGAMLTRGMEPEASNFYDQALKRGDILVAVECIHAKDVGACLAQAEQILAHEGSRPIPLPEG